MFTAALLITAPNWKQSTCPLSVGRINKSWCADTLEYYAAMKMNGQQLQATAWLNLTIVTKSKRSQTKRVHEVSQRKLEEQTRSNTIYDRGC